jgi:hypothetical protein
MDRCRPIPQMAVEYERMFDTFLVWKEILSGCGTNVGRSRGHRTTE